MSDLSVAGLLNRKCHWDVSSAHFRNLGTGLNQAWATWPEDASALKLVR